MRVSEGGWKEDGQVGPHVMNFGEKAGVLAGPLQRPARACVLEQELDFREISVIGGRFGCTWGLGDETPGFLHLPLFSGHGPI